MEYHVDQIKKLRDKTGVGIMACRKALAEVGGDAAEAEKMLAEQALVRAGNRSDREVSEGVVSAYIHTNGRIGALVELRSETDFVSRGADFRGLARELAMQVCALNPESVDVLLDQAWIRDAQKTVRQLVSELGAKTKENVVVARFARFKVGE